MQAFLPEALESVRRQTLPVREIVVVDDGSTVPVEAPAGWDGPPLTIVRTENRGLPAARNAGIDHCSGDLIGFLDADDLWHPRKIAAQTAALMARRDAVACYTRCDAGPGFFAFGPYPAGEVSDDEFMLVLWANQFFPPSSVV